ANVDADRRRNDCAARRYHTSDCCTNAPMHIGHSRDPLVDERQLRDVQKLLARGVLQRDALRPRLDRCALVGLHHVVSCLCHRLSFLASNTCVTDLVARHGIEPYPLAFQTSTLPSSSRAKLWWTVRELNSHFTG